MSNANSATIHRHILYKNNLKSYKSFSSNKKIQFLNAKKENIERRKPFFYILAQLNTKKEEEEGAATTIKEI